MKFICFIHQKCSENYVLSLYEVIRDLYSNNVRTRTNEIASFIMNCAYLAAGANA